MPWHTFWLLCCRAGQFDARQLLYHGVEDAGLRAQLAATAFPYRRSTEILCDAPAVL